MIHQIVFELLEDFVHLFFVNAVSLLHISEIADQPVVVELWSLRSENFEHILHFFLVLKDISYFLQYSLVDCAIHVVVLVNALISNQFFVQRV